MSRFFNGNQRDRKIPGDPIREQFPANGAIKAPKVRLIDENGQNLGIKEFYQANGLAKSLDLDVVLISPTADPPVAKLCDYNKFIYDQKQAKKEQEKKSRESAVVIKEVQLRPNIGEHDLEVKRKHTQEWLDEGHKIKIVVKFRGREMAHSARGFEMVNTFIASLTNVKIDKNPEMGGNTIMSFLSPAIKSNQ
jgi:translation initiation factor IF-3